MTIEEKKFIKAKNLHLSGNYKDAQKIYLSLIENNKNNFLLHNLVGTTYLQLNDYDNAIFHLKISIKLKPDFADNYNNFGIALAEKKRFHEALKCYEKALELKKNYFSALLNKGIALKNLNNLKIAVSCFEKCIKIDPKNPQIYLNLGNIFVLLKKYKDAKKLFDKAIQLNKNYAEAYSNRGELFQLHLKEIKLAINDYTKALKYNNKLNYVYGKLIHAKMQINDWENFENQMDTLKRNILEKKKIITPFPLLSLIDEPKLHKLTAEQYSNERYPFSKKLNKKSIINQNKIKIGYFSARFYDCATLHNMLDVFKNHDMDKFEIFGFNYGTEDLWTKEIKKYFTKFFNISNLSLKDIENLSEENQLQIAVNLTGYTSSSRDEIFNNNIAPIQINFLGYPGTLGSKMYDYILADKIVIPKRLEKFYSEKILRLPNCYLPTQSNQKISETKFEKKELGIPENKFVFACFNNSYKITPDIFECWVNILKRNKESVFWLLKSNNSGESNLRREFEKKGIDINRIIFAERMTVEDHIKRMGHIDLFLDTFPYNAHTTAREAIKMNVPVLTLMGESFASRVAGSILKNIGLENLIVKNFDDYTKKAIQLSFDKNKTESLKKYLKNENNTKKLFNSKMYTRHLEKIYQDIIK